MTPTTAIPVPTEPPKIPNRWVDVADQISSQSQCSYALSARVKVGREPDEGWRRYLLPGTELSAALAELERASDGLEEDFDEDGKATPEMIEHWLEARRKVRELTKGTNP